MRPRNSRIDDLPAWILLTFQTMMNIRLRDETGCAKQGNVIYSISFSARRMKIPWLPVLHNVLRHGGARIRGLT